MTPQKVFINDIIYASNNGFKMKVTLLGWYKIYKANILVYKTKNTTEAVSAFNEISN